MNRLFYLCSMAFLALCIVGCGKDSPAETKAAPSASEEVDFATLIHQGVDAIAQKDAAKAANVAAKALALQPESAEVHLLAGQAACLGKDYAQAREQFTSVIKEASLPPVLRAKAYAGLGTVEFEQNDAELARISFLNALLLDFRNDAAQYYLGRIYRDFYYFNDAARGHFQMFESLRRGTPLAEKVKTQYIPEIQRMIERKLAERFGAGGGNAEQAAKLIQEAQALEDKKKFAEAAKKYEAARKADPRSYAAALGYARLVKYVEKGAWIGKSIKAYCDAIALKPQTLENYLSAARVAREDDEGFKIQAVEILNHAVAHNPSDVSALDLLVSALRKTGNSKLFNAWGEYRQKVVQQKTAQRGGKATSR